jgi:hypothetical protein
MRCAENNTIAPLRDGPLLGRDHVCGACRCNEEDVVRRDDVPFLEMEPTALGGRSVCIDNAYRSRPVGDDL